VVIYNRLPIVTSTGARRLLRTAWENVRERFPFAIDAVCLLPEHIHCIWKTRNESRRRRGEAALVEFSPVCQDRAL
jgi:REP element-mobilizing transposase RayT